MNLTNLLSSIINELSLQTVPKPTSYILSPHIYNIDYIEDLLKKNNITYKKKVINKDAIDFELNPKDVRKLWKIMFLDKKSIKYKIYSELEN